MISKDKTYCTRGGQEVRIYATDAGGLFPVHGAIFQDGTWHGMKWTEEGKTLVNTVDDLVEVKPRIKRTVWLHVFNTGTVCATEDAYYDITNRIACVKVEIDCEEGKGL